MTSRPILIALFVSLACNLFLVGALVGGLVVGGRLKAAGAEPRGPVWRAADTLAPEHRRAYRQALRGEAEPVAGALRDARRARREAWRGLAREPFDAERVITELDRARASEMKARATIERRIVEFAGSLPPEERAEFAEGLEQMGPRLRVRSEGPPGPPGPPPAAQRD